MSGLHVRSMIAALALYSSGQTSGMVVDVGLSGARVSCVYEGYVVPDCCVSSGVVRKAATIEAPCSPLISVCQRSGPPRRLNHRRFWQGGALLARQLMRAPLKRSDALTAAGACPRTWSDCASDVMEALAVVGPPALASQDGSSLGSLPSSTTAEEAAEECPAVGDAVFRLRRGTGKGVVGRPVSVTRAERLQCGEVLLAGLPAVRDHDHDHDRGNMEAEAEAEEEEEEPRGGAVLGLLGLIEMAASKFDGSVDPSLIRTMDVVLAGARSISSSSVAFGLPILTGWHFTMSHLFVSTHLSRN
jgi:hypothetical protein